MPKDRVGAYATLREESEMKMRQVGHNEDGRTGQESNPPCSGTMIQIGKKEQCWCGSGDPMHRP